MDIWKKGHVKENSIDEGKKGQEILFLTKTCYRAIMTILELPMQVPPRLDKPCIFPDT